MEGRRTTARCFTKLHASKSHEVEGGIEEEEEKEVEEKEVEVVGVGVVVLAVDNISRGSLFPNNRSLILEILIPCFVSSSIVPA